MELTAHRSRRLGLRVGMLLVAPVLGLILAETLLALLGLFPPIRLLKTVQRDGEDYVVTNPEYARLFLPREDSPMPAAIWVTRSKRPGVMRVVLLGESAAAGYPLPEFSLARLVEHVWAERYPEQPLEVVNLTMVAVNSHILRQFAREAMILKPDVVMLYAGHNEVIGPFGPVSVFGRAYSSLNLIRLNLLVRNTRVGRALASAYFRLRKEKGENVPRWMGLDEFMDIPIRRDDPRLKNVSRHAAANVKDIIELSLRHQARVLVCLPALNLTDWPPLGSADAQLSNEEALSAWRRGEKDRLTSAWQVYQLARQMEKGGDRTSAWPLYRLACDLDLYRFRMDSGIRHSINELRGKWPVGRVAFMDTDRAMHEENANFTSDRDYFFEHVHLTFAARSMVASLLVDGLAGLTGKPVGVAQGMTVSDMAVRTLFTPFDEYAMWQSIWDLLSLGVFAHQPEGAERKAFIVGMVKSLRSSMEQRWDAERVRWAYDAARTRTPEDVMLDFIAGRLLEQLKHRAEAEQAVRHGLNRMPVYAEGQLTLARLLLAKADYQGAASALDEASISSPHHPRLPILRGELYARSGQLELALPYLLQSVSANPSNHGVLVNLATVQMLLKEDVKAINNFEKCLQIEPSDPTVLNNYAWLLATSSHATESQRRQSLGFVQKAIRLRPTDKRFLATLALALVEEGRLEEAREVAGNAWRAARDSGDQESASNLMAELARKNVFLDTSSAGNDVPR